MSGCNRSYIDTALYMQCMERKHQSIKDKFRGREAQYEAVLTQNIFCVHVLSITIFCPRVVGKLVLPAITHFSVVISFLKKLNADLK